MNAYQANLERYQAAEARLREVEAQRARLTSERDASLAVLRAQPVTIDDLVECVRLQKLNLLVGHVGKKTRLTLTRNVKPALSGFEEHKVYEVAGSWNFVKAAALEALVKLDADRLPEALGASDALDELLVRAGAIYHFEYETRAGQDHRLKIENYSASNYDQYTTVFDSLWHKELGTVIEGAKSEMEKRTVGLEVG